MSNKIQKIGIFPVQKKAGENQDEDTITYQISGQKKDRAGDIIMVDGWIFPKFIPILWGHDHSIPSIGRSVKVWVEGEKVFMDFVFGTGNFAQDIKQAVQDGVIQAGSVGFRHLEWEFIDKKKRYDGGIRFLKQELLEFTICNVGMHQDAMQVKSMDDVDNLEDKDYNNMIENITKENKISDGRESLQENVKNVIKEEEGKVTLSLSSYEKLQSDMEVKAGKVISQKNKTLLEKALKTMEDSSVMIKGLLEASDKEEDKALRSDSDNPDKLSKKGLLEIVEDVNKATKLK